MSFDRLKYEDFSDRSLISAIQQNDECAFEVLFNRYRPIVWRWKRYAMRLYNDQDDYSQEAAICLLQCVNKFNDHGGASFGTYYSWSLYNQLCDAMRRSFTQKRRANFHTASLQYQVMEDGSYWQNQLESSDPFMQPEYVLMIREQMQSFYSSLSSFELAVFQYFIKGHSWAEIAKYLNSNEKKVSTAYNRCRKKFIDLVKNNSCR